MIDRPMAPRMALAVIGVLGALNGLYLSLQRLFPGRTAPLKCSLVGDCAAVQASAYSQFPPGVGIPVAYLGLAGFAGLLLISLLMIGRDRLGRLALPPLLLFAATLGLAFSAYLTAIEAFVLHEWCQWCVVSASLMLLFWGLALWDWTLWRRGDPAGDAEELAEGGAAR
ncbi:MAG TPA: vitamin K epoxide reductase family protein [Herpetosiphonaceae bacterium]|nr:vitamin K epoxide reductase family protein [Herpetosiphonaceae bacterium]